MTVWILLKKYKTEMHPEQTVSINKGSMAKKLTLHFQHTSPTQANLLVLEAKKVSTNFRCSLRVNNQFICTILITACWPQQVVPRSPLKLKLVSFQEDRRGDKVADPLLLSKFPILFKERVSCGQELGKTQSHSCTHTHMHLHMHRHTHTHT